MSKKQNRSEKEPLTVSNAFKFSKQKEVSLSDFEWPSYKTEKERIRQNTKKYENYTIVEAFEEEFKCPINVQSEIPECIPNELNIGDIINVDILGVQKRAINFSTINLKSNLYSVTDLYKYKKFRDMTSPLYNIPVKVVDIKKNEVRVDIVNPMLIDFVMPRVKQNWIQKKLNDPQVIKVKNLQLTRGGFMGKAVIPNISNFLGEEYTIDAFIPGSQIVLNITDNFEQFIGKTVEAFVVNYIQRPGSDKMSLVCSVKEYLKFKGEEIMIDAFNHWCEEDETWDYIKNKKLAGKVTGIINSSKKCGVFVEIPESNITGMISVPPTELVKYKPNDRLWVNITGFEEEMYFNQAAQQMQHVDPYKITDECIEKCTLKPILKISK